MPISAQDHPPGTDLAVDSSSAREAGPARGRPRGLTVTVCAVALAVSAILCIEVARAGLPPLALAVALVVPVPLLAAGGAFFTRRVAREPGRYPRALLIFPAAYYVSFFVIPLMVLVMFAFATRSGFSDITFGFDTANFSEALSGIYVDAFVRSIRFAVIGTVCTIAVGFPFAYWLARHAPAQRRNVYIALIMIPFWTSFLIRTYAMIVILSDDFWLAKALRGFNLIDGDLGLLYHSGGVQIGLVYGYLPLFILPLYATMERLDWSLVQAAQDLGATKLKAFLSVTVPLAMPGILVGGLLVFIPMTGEYVIPAILGGGQIDLIGNVIARAFLEQQNYPFGAALGTLVMLALTAVMAIYIVTSVRSERKVDA